MFKPFSCPTQYLVRDGPLENLWGGGRAKYKKKFAQGKIKWKKFLHAN